MSPYEFVLTIAALGILAFVVVMLIPDRKQ